MSKIQNEIKELEIEIEVKLKIMKLEEQILKHKKLYYQGIPEIHDHEYDELEAALMDIDCDNPVLQMVGYEID